MADFVFKYGSRKQPKVRVINSYDAWHDAFCKYDSPKHWREGRSAQSLAADFSLPDGTGREMLVRLVEQVSGYTVTVPIEACIEHESRLDDFRGTARMQDLAVFGKLSNNQTFFVGVEAKVDETFDETIGEKAKTIAKYKINHHTTQQHNRLMNLVEDFFHVKIDRDGFPELSDIDSKTKELRYQLLYYLAGSFRENADVIFMPVVVYKSNGCKYECYDLETGKANQKDYFNFIDSLGFTEFKNVRLEEQTIPVFSAQITDAKTNISKTIFTCYIVK